MRIIPIIGGVLVLHLSSCSMYEPILESEMAAPDDWFVTSNRVNDCSEIDGTYQNIGLGFEDDLSNKVDGRLDVAIGETMPSSRQPENIQLVFNQVNQEVEFTFLGIEPFSFSTEAECHNVIVVIQKTQKNLYLGDGTNLDHRQIALKLFKGIDGSLIVHKSTNSQFSTLGIFKSKEAHEYWFKFHELENID